MTPLCLQKCPAITTQAPVAVKTVYFTARTMTSTPLWKNCHLLKSQLQLPIQYPLSSCSLPTVPPPKFTFGATDIRLWNATMSSSAGDPMVTPRVPLKPLQPHQVEAGTHCNLTVTIKGMNKIPKHHCPICHEDVISSLCCHAYQQHVPWYANPSHICCQCFQLFHQHTHLEAHLKTSACSKSHF